ncbi:MAG: MBL fold metallo-hydrolase [Chloroflexia bacterium]
MEPRPVPVAPDVYGLDLGLLGMAEYGAGYIVRGKEGVALVEVGTSLCVPRILAGLETLGIAPEEVTHILCTHIHLDHAGAAGHLLEHLPRARVVIHSRDHRHLAQPARLLESVAQAVGTLFPLYGEVRPISPERLLPGEELRLDLGGGVRLEAVPTPGHSRDHLSYFLPHLGLLFPGDAAGVSLFGHRFSRPVTVPPAFDPIEMLRSLGVLRALRPAALCFTHFGRHDDPEAVFDHLEETLRRWDELARTVGVEAAGDAVFAANLPPPGSEPAALWQAIAEMNRRGFIQAYRSDEGARRH